MFFCHFCLTDIPFVYDLIFLAFAIFLQKLFFLAVLCILDLMVLDIQQILMNDKYESYTNIIRLGRPLIISGLF